MTGSRDRVARAFAPGHITGIFRPDVTSRDPRGRGSVGAGVVLELGVWAEATHSPGTRTRVQVEGDGPGPWPISEEAARRMAYGLPGRVTVRLLHQVPVGQGFGTSAAGALATALAVGALAGRSRAEAVAVAHLSDLFGGGGLGGVSSILGGGLEVRLRPGIPPIGKAVHRPFPPSLLIGVVGKPIPSPEVLRDPRALRRISQASAGWERLRDHPTVGQFLRVSERFTDRAGLSSPTIIRAVRSLRRCGAWAGQAMFGESFFAVPRSSSARTKCLEWLREEDLPAVELHAAGSGARWVRSLPASLAGAVVRRRRAPQAF